MKVVVKIISVFLVFSIIGSLFCLNSFAEETNLLVEPTFDGGVLVTHSGSNPGFAFDGVDKSNVVESAEDANGDGKSIKITNRTSNYVGIRYNYMPSDYQKTYMISAKLKLAESGSATAYIEQNYSNSSRIGEPDNYHKIGNIDSSRAVDLSGSEWKEVKCMYTYNVLSHPEQTRDFTHLRFYLSNSTSDVLIDDIKLVEVKNLFSYSEPSFANGSVLTSVFGKNIGAFNANNGTASVVSDSAETVKAQDGDGYYAKVTGRSSSGNGNGGLRIINFGLQKGMTYIFSVWVRVADETSGVMVQPNIEKASVNYVGNLSWKSISSSEWTKLTYMFTVDDNSTYDFAHIGIKTNVAGNTCDLLFDNFSLYTYKAEASDGNLIDNGGFELGDMSSWVAKSMVTADVSDKYAFSGNFGAKVTPNEGAMVRDQAFKSKDLTVDKNSYYYLSCYAKSEANEEKEAFVRLQGSGSTGRESVPTDSAQKMSTGWKKFESVVYTNEMDKVFYTLQLSKDVNDSAYTYLIDDARMYKISAASASEKLTESGNLTVYAPEDINLKKDNIVLKNESGHTAVINSVEHFVDENNISYWNISYSDVSGGEDYKLTLELSGLCNSANYPEFTFSSEQLSNFIIENRSLTVNGNEYGECAYIPETGHAEICSSLKNKTEEDTTVYLYTVVFDNKDRICDVSLEMKNIKAKSTDVIISEADITENNSIVKIFAWDSNIRPLCNYTLYSVKLYENCYMPNIFSDHMVLQRNQNVNIYGFAPDDTQIRVNFGKNEVSGVASNGTFNVTLPPMNADNVGKTLSVVMTKNDGTQEEFTYSDVVVGDVIYGNGQSNMALSVYSTLLNNLKDRLPYKDNIRYFNVSAEHASTKYRVDNPESVKESWVCPTESDYGNASATLYATAYALREYGIIEDDVPIGLVKCAYGGSSIGDWSTFKNIIKEQTNSPYYYNRYVNGAYTDNNGNNVYMTDLYYTMAKPFANYTYKLAIWYQGETDVKRQDEYSYLLKDIIQQTRNDFGYDIPYFIVQLPGYTTTNDGEYWPQFRLMQWEFDNPDNSVYVVSIGDTGSVNEDHTYAIHPEDKDIVGQRIARKIAHFVYNKDIPYTGPVYKSHSVSGANVEISFDYVNDGIHGGLTLNNAEGFEVAGEDGIFYPVTNAVIEGNNIVVSSENVSAPLYVRYDFTPTPLKNAGTVSEGIFLPLVPFSTMISE